MAKRHAFFFIYTNKSPPSAFLARPMNGLGPDPLLPADLGLAIL
jgi:hypothetical protein